MVEVQRDWQLASAVLAAGLPFVASIRFAEGELPGSPLRATRGHLIVVYGLTENEVLTLDPAAADDAGVPRRYPADAFARAWLSHRGAAYILLP
jgi:hypothetical protein